MKINLPYPPKYNVIREIAKFEMYSILHIKTMEIHKNEEAKIKYQEMS